MSAGPSHTGVFGKFFHHKHRDEHHDEHGATPGDHDEVRGVNHPEQESEVNKVDHDLKKEENKLKNYLDKDKELEEEGETYGGLM